MFGVGGGVVVVPGLVLWMALDQHRASGTSIATIVASSAAAAVLFSAEGDVDWGSAALIALAAGLGAAVAARHINRIPELWLTRMFVALMLVASVRLYLA